MDVDTSDLWTCPACGKRFVTRNMSHSCGRHTVEQFMEGKGLAFMVRARFAGMRAVSEGGMSFSFWLKERIESPRVRKVEYYGRTDWGYHVRVTSIDDLDEEVQGWLCRSYEVGCQLR